MGAETATPWYKSKTVQGSAWIVLSAFLGALVPMLQARSVDWWSLGAVTLTALIVAGRRCFDPDVEGPLPVMNRNNVSGVRG